MPFTGPAEDKLAIRELYDTYGDASCRGDVETFLTCWADDGRWNTHIFNRWPGPVPPGIAPPG